MLRSLIYVLLSSLMCFFALPYLFAWYLVDKHGSNVVRSAILYVQNGGVAVKDYMALHAFLLAMAIVMFYTLYKFVYSVVSFISGYIAKKRSAKLQVLEG